MRSYRFLKRFPGGRIKLRVGRFDTGVKMGNTAKKLAFNEVFLPWRGEKSASLAARPRRSKACSAGVRPRENVGLFIKFPSSIWKNMEIVVHVFEI